MLAQTPESPTTWPRLLIPNAKPTVSPSNGASCRVAAVRLPNHGLKPKARGFGSGAIEIVDIGVREADHLPAIVHIECVRIVAAGKKLERA